MFHLLNDLTFERPNAGIELIYFVQYSTDFHTWEPVIFGYKSVLALDNRGAGEHWHRRVDIFVCDSTL